MERKKTRNNQNLLILGGILIDDCASQCVDFSIWFLFFSFERLRTTTYVEKVMIELMFVFLFASRLNAAHAMRACRLLIVIELQIALECVHMQVQYGFLALACVRLHFWMTSGFRREITSFSSRSISCGFHHFNKAILSWYFSRLFETFFEYFKLFDPHFSVNTIF